MEPEFEPRVPPHQLLQRINCLASSLVVEPDKPGTCYVLKLRSIGVAYDVLRALNVLTN